METKQLTLTAKQAARATYQGIQKPAWAEYQAARATYERIQRAALAEYLRAIADKQ